MDCDVALWWQEFVADCYHGELSDSDANARLHALGSGIGSWLVHHVCGDNKRVVIRFVMEGGEVGAVTLERLDVDKRMEFTLLVASAELRWDEETIKKVKERRGDISWWVGKKGLLKRGVMLETRVGSSAGCAIGEQ